MRRRWWILAAVSSLALAASCKGEILPPQGEIIIVIETDVAMPDSIDRIQVEVQTNGVSKFSQEYDVGVGKLSIPATLGVLQGPDPLAPILFRVIGRKRGAARTLREVLTTIPSERIAALRMPIRWMCDDTAAEKIPVTSPPSAEGKRCPSGQTCIGGDCYGPQIDSSLLPDFTEGDRGGGACFNVVQCMSGATEVAMDVATCTFAKPLVTTNLNVALKVQNDGICDPTKTSCFVILDRVTNAPGAPLDGWREAGDRIQLTPEVCKRLTATPKRIDAVVVSTSCPAKPVNLPVCGNSNPIGGPDGGPSVDPPEDEGPPLNGPVGPLSAAGNENNSKGVSVVFGSSFIFGSAQVTPPPLKLKLNIVDVIAKTNNATFTQVTNYASFFISSGAAHFLNYPGSITPLDTLDVGRIDPSTHVASIVRTLPNTPLAVSQQAPIVGDAARMYWLRGHALESIGGELWSGLAANASSDQMLSTFAPEKAFLRALAVDKSPSGFVYVAIGYPDGPSFARVVRVLKTASTSTPPSLVAQLPTNDVSGITVDGADLYVVGSANLDFGPPRTMFHIPAAGGAVTVRYDARTLVGRVIVSGSELFWLEDFTQGTGFKYIYKASKAGGGAPTPIGVASNGYGLTDFGVSKDRVYYLEESKPPSARWDLRSLTK